MKKEIQFILCICAISCMAVTCKKQSSDTTVVTPPKDSSLVNTSHLDYLSTAVTFPGGAQATGVYIYSEAPDYHKVGAGNEGYTCVDDVARATQVYLRNPKFATDATIQ